MKRNLLLGSWFISYRLGGISGGAPNAIWRYPHSIVLFDEIFCDKYAFIAEKNAYDEMNWTGSWLFEKLYEEGILKPVDFRKKFPELEIFTPLSNSEIKKWRKKFLNDKTFFTEISKHTEDSALAILAEKIESRPIPIVFPEVTSIDTPITSPDFPKSEIGISQTKSTIEKAQIFLELTCPSISLMESFDS